MEESELEFWAKNFSNKFVEELALSDITEKIKMNPQCRDPEGFAKYMERTDFKRISQDEYILRIKGSEIGVFSKIDYGTGKKVMKVLFSVNGIFRSSQSYELPYVKSA